MVFMINKNLVFIDSMQFMDPTTSHRVFETNSSFHVKQHTTGKV